MLAIPCYGPFYVVWSMIKFAWSGIDKFLSKYTDAMVEKWINSIDQFAAMNLYEYSYNNYLHRPSFTKNKSDWELLKKWAINNGYDLDTEEGQQKLQEYFESIKEEHVRRLAKAADDRLSNWNKTREIEEKRQARADAIKRNLDNVFGPIYDGIKSIKAALTFDSYGKVIKITKRIIGLLFTGVIATGVYFIVQIISFLILKIVSIWSSAAIWATIVTAFPYILATVIGIVAIIGLIKLTEYISDLYRSSSTHPLWLTIISYPFIGLYYIILYCVWYPVYFLTVSFIWKFIFVGLIWGILRGFGKGILSFGGIFGEYFSASYGDTCPGIKWDNEED